MNDLEQKYKEAQLRAAATVAEAQAQQEFREGQQEVPQDAPKDEEQMIAGRPKSEIEAILTAAGIVRKDDNISYGVMSETDRLRRYARGY